MSKTFSVQSKSVYINSSEPSSPRTLIIENGKIARLEKYGSVADAIDFGSHTIFPGIVDTHAHINEPGRTDWEGFITATRAAAAGGITTVIDMPLNSIPPTTTLKNFEIKKTEAQGKCSIDYGFWGGVIPGNAAELGAMVHAGVLGFKCFTIDSGVPEFPMVKETILREAMPILKKNHAPLLVHAELESTVKNSEHNHQHYNFYLNSRPQSWEVNAIQLIIKLVRETGCSAHIVHLSAADALTDIRRAKEEGLPLTVETCPHYLYFHAETIPSGATHYKCAPPIREKKNQDGLWAALLDGTIDCIVSDHSPCTPHLKCRDTGDFEKAWGGISGLQFSMPVVWTQMQKRGIAFSHLIQWMCENTAKLAQLQTQKGSLNIGFDADFVVFDAEQPLNVCEETTQHRHKLTPYENKPLLGKVHQTYVRGHCVFDEGKFLNKPVGEPVR